MAGSLNHLVADDGTLKLDTIENLGDAAEALTECFHVIRWLTRGDRIRINGACRAFGYPEIDHDLRSNGDVPE